MTSSVIITSIVLAGGHLQAYTSKALSFLIISVFVMWCSATQSKVLVSSSSVEKVKAHFKAERKRVITFIGYSNSGYRDEGCMLNLVKGILTEMSPSKVIINIGGTKAGIGEAYRLAKQMKFETTGILSSLGKTSGEISPFVDKVFFIEDSTWGGFLKSSQILSPVSKAIIEVSDLVVGIGGGQVGADEMLTAYLSGKKVLFYPAGPRNNSLDSKGVAHEALSQVMTIRSHTCIFLINEIPSDAFGSFN